MTKKLIASLVGALILFIWQFLSYGPLNIHVNQMDYTPVQDELLGAFEQANLEPGEYFLPRAPLSATSADQQKMYEQYKGKPYATLQYHAQLEYSMGGNMLRGFVVDFLAVFILSWLLMQFAQLTMYSSILASLGVGLIGYFTINYLDHIWFEVSSLPDLIDAIVPWTLIGIWMGYWLNRS